MASTSLSSVHSGTDRYSTTSVGNGASNDRRFDDESLSASNFELLLNLPLFETPPTPLPVADSFIEPPPEEDAAVEEDEVTDENGESGQSESPHFPVIVAHQPAECFPPPKPVSSGVAESKNGSGKKTVQAPSKSQPVQSKEPSVQTAVYREVVDEKSDQVEPIRQAATFDPKPNREHAKTAPTEAKKLDPVKRPQVDARDESTPAQPLPKENVEAPLHDKPRSRERTDESAKESKPSVEALVEPAKVSQTPTTASYEHAPQPIEAAPSENNDRSQGKLGRRAERLESNRRADSDEREQPFDKAQAASKREPVAEAKDGNSPNLPTAIDPSTAAQPSPLSASVPSLSLAPASLAPASVAGSIVTSTRQAALTPDVAKTAFDGTAGHSINAVGASTSPSSVSSGSARSSGASEPRGTSLTKYQEHRVLQRVLRGMEQLENNGSQVRLRLHPPELGSLQVTIRVESQQMSTLIEVEHSAARDVLESNLPQLQAKLSEQGITVQQFEIRVVDPNNFSQGGQLGNAFQQSSRQSGEQREERRASNYVDRLRNRIDQSRTDATSPTSQRRWTRTNGRLDVTV